MRLPESLPAGIEVHRLDLDLEQVAPDIWRALTGQERARAERFLRAADRVRFAATRAAARRLLARRLDCEAADVPIALGAHGKPSLDAGADAPLFNVSHAGAHALIVLADAGAVQEVGIDIERCRDDTDIDAVLPLAFTARERDEVRAATDRRQAFYSRWVGKEALLKAIGVGVSEHLQCIGVHPGANACFAIECAVPEWTNFEAMALAAPPGYAAALAWRAKEPT
jgi:4'-phosphopantetheinyl transferase